MRCSSCLGRGRSSRGQADQLPDSSPHSQHVPTLLPGCPEEGQLLIGGGEGWGRGNLGGCQLNLLPKWKQGPKKATGKDESSDTKGKQGAKGKTGGNGHPRDCKIYLHQMEKLKTRKERSYVWLISHTLVSQWSLSTFSYNPEEYFYQLFCECNFLSSSSSIFKMVEHLPHPFLKYKCFCKFNWSIVNLHHWSQ